MKFRAVRFETEKGSFACIITNLPRDRFPPKKIKKLYAMRWGVETSFRKLKHTIGLANFHAKLKGYIIQEIYARCIMYNFVELIAQHTNIEKPASQKRKHECHANYAAATAICREFLRHFIQNGENKARPNVEALIAQRVLPIRPERQAPCKIAKKRAYVGFNYRIA
jgi:hypothetical protein